MTHDMVHDMDCLSYPCLYKCKQKYRDYYTKQQLLPIQLFTQSTFLYQPGEE